jgi:cytochrome d ubiquinol oxidase subunit II
MIMFWVAVLALTTLLYVILDGFDLGVGILFGFTRNEELRRKMLSAISPVWDGNETWLIFTGTILFGAFPRVYATLLSAFYLPITLMLGALILRGVAFEFRYKATSTRWLWDLGFCGGSLIASLGAGWLTAKCEGVLRARAHALLRPLTIGVFSFLAVAFVYALVLDLRIMNRWIERPYLLIFPAIGAVASVFLVRGISDQNDGQPFRMTALIFLSAFGTLAISFWPFMIPFAVTIDQAAAPPSSLYFMFWGAGLFVLPLTLTYTGAVYRVFRGKIVEAAEEY